MFFFTFADKVNALFSHVLLPLFGQFSQFLSHNVWTESQKGEEFHIKQRRYLRVILHINFSKVRSQFLFGLFTRNIFGELRRFACLSFRFEVFPLCFDFDYSIHLWIEMYAFVHFSLLFVRHCLRCVSFNNLHSRWQHFHRINDQRYYNDRNRINFRYNNLNSLPNSILFTLIFLRII